MLLDEYISRLQNFTDEKITYAKVAQVLKLKGKQAVGMRIKRNQELEEWEILALDRRFNKSTKSTQNDKINCIPITYLPEIYLSAGFGVENYYEDKDIMMIDAALLISERGSRINPQYCKIVKISGNSMSPEYRHGDRVIIDENDTELSDGQIFAFRYNGKCFVKELNLLGRRIKCISLNKDYDPFYIEEGEEITILGRILPRIRL